MTKSTYKPNDDKRIFLAGQEVETVYGEKLTVIKVEAVILKKKGEPTGEVERRILARSGDQKVKQKNKQTGEMEEVDLLTWFPLELIK